MTTHPKTLPSPFLPFENLTEGLIPEELPDFKQSIQGVLRSHELIYEQKRDSLAGIALNALAYPGVSAVARQLIEDGVICLINEGAAPYHPRYVAPLYDRLLANGSSFMELKPAVDLYDATASLITAYKYIPCGGLPVFIGRIDELLEPYYPTVTPAEAYKVLRSFWLLVDRLNPSAFVHANIGPQRTHIGDLLLDVDRELKTLTNLTLRYDPQGTPRDFALKAVRNALELTKPYFLDHRRLVSEWGEDYVIASCYNSMRLGGGIYTLVRVNLKEMVKLAEPSIDDLLQRVIPMVAEKQVEVIRSRVRAIVEDADWFEQNFWIDEGLILKDCFTAYAAVFGLAEGVNDMLARLGRPQARFGQDAQANQLAADIVGAMHAALKKLAVPFCQGWDETACLHAQVGISTDVGVTPGVRIPSSEEPDLYAHLQTEGRSHRWIEGGASTILEFDQTAAGNPDALLDIIQGAFKAGVRNLSIGSANSEFVRVTGYLIRRSDMETAKAHKALRHSSAILGSEFMQTKPNHLHRVTRKV
jgi:YjjI family glycine radical enzyme